MVAADGLASRTDCTVLATSQMDCSSEASPSALVEDTSSYDTKCASCLCILITLPRQHAKSHSMLHILKVSSLPLSVHFGQHVSHGVSHHRGVSGDLDEPYGVPPCSVVVREGYSFVVSIHAVPTCSGHGACCAAHH